MARTVHILCALTESGLCRGRALMLAAERVVLAAVNAQHEFAPYVYGARFIAFGLVIAGVVDKSRAR